MDSVNVVGGLGGVWLCKVVVTYTAVVKYCTRSD